MALLKLIEEKYLSTLISTHCKHNFCNLTVTTVKFFVFSERKKTVTLYSSTKRLFVFTVIIIIVKLQKLLI